GVDRAGGDRVRAGLRRHGRRLLGRVGRVGGAVAGRGRRGLGDVAVELRLLGLAGACGHGGLLPSGFGWGRACARPRVDQATRTPRRRAAALPEKTARPQKNSRRVRYTGFASISPRSRTDTPPLVRPVTPPSAMSSPNLTA